MEEGAGADHLLLLGERDGAIADDLVEGLDGLEVTVEERLGGSASASWIVDHRGPGEFAERAKDRLASSLR